MAGLWIIVLGLSFWEISSCCGLCGACTCSAAVGPGSAHRMLWDKILQFGFESLAFV